MQLILLYMYNVLIQISNILSVGKPKYQKRFDKDQRRAAQGFAWESVTAGLPSEWQYSLTIAFNTK